MSERVQPFILAGGISERFGTDKALHTWRGRALVDHVLDSFRLAMGPFDIWLGVRAVHLRPALMHHFSGWEITWVEDRSSIEGPLASLAAGLTWAQAQQREWLFVCACDFPALTATLVSGLIDLALDSPDAAAVVPWPNDGRRHPYQPLCALYRPGPALEHLEQHVAAGHHARLMDFVDSLPQLRAVDSDELNHLDPTWRRALHNVNTRDDLDAIDREDGVDEIEDRLQSLQGLF